MLLISYINWHIYISVNKIIDIDIDTDSVQQNYGTLESKLNRVFSLFAWSYEFWHSSMLKQYSQYSM